MREIGSEFWEQYSLNGQSNAGNIKFLASGRTALDFIIKDALLEKNIRSALLPAYCCISMIEPFLRNRIYVDFYKFDSNGIDYNYSNKNDIVLLIDFFGFEILENEKIARSENCAGKVVIYDSTHKLNGNEKVEQWSHYSFCSYRKWFYCNFASAKKYSGVFVHNDEGKNINDYVTLRDQARSIKEQYISGETVEKSEFLTRFNDAERILENNYCGRIGEAVKYPMKDIISKRQENAKYLIKKLLYNTNIKLIFNKVLDDDAPLFVPILVSPNIRDRLRNHLISNNIFCPIHWPKTKFQKKYSDLYDSELSLICDQRYDLSDMERIVKEIENFFGE